ncbi:hypothetical protein LPJ74_002355 [Coemansia sp. RSA 1843]|nr:hypothetical protein LPJ74_002355 [Coemansia sp. RSA 1843]
MLRMLRRQCFELYKIDEFRTSTLCPSDERIQYMKEKLREKSGDESRAEDDPGATVEGRYWNRNIAAALNFKTITHSLRTVKRVPELVATVSSDPEVQPRSRSKRKAATASMSAATAPEQEQTVRGKRADLQ